MTAGERLGPLHLDLQGVHLPTSLSLESPLDTVTSNDNISKSDDTGTLCVVRCA